MFDISSLCQQLGTALKRKRESLGLSLAEVKEETGVGTSTLSRIERGVGAPDADNIARLAEWLEIPSERLFRDDLSKVITLDKPLPDIVVEHLNRDENLTAEAKDFLSTFFTQTYKQFLKIEKSRKTGGKTNAFTPLYPLS